MTTDDLPGTVEWKDETVFVDGLEVSPGESVKIQSRSIGPGILSRVEDTRELPAYLDSYQRDERRIPEYYSRFPDGRRATLSEADDLRGDEYASASLAAEPVWFGVRALNGSGRYPAGEHVLYDCLPYPCILVRKGVGAVAIAPRVQPADTDDSDEEDDVIIIE